MNRCSVDCRPCFSFFCLTRFSADQLRVFSSSSREGLEEQLAQEDRGHQFEFGHGSSISARENDLFTTGGTENVRTRGGIVPGEGIHCRRHPTIVERELQGVHHAGSRGLEAPERRRLELESGAGGDHDLPYWFTGPSSMPQALAWMSFW